MTLFNIRTITCFTVVFCSVSCCTQAALSLKKSSQKKPFIVSQNQSRTQNSIVRNMHIAENSMLSNIQLSYSDDSKEECDQLEPRFTSELISMKCGIVNAGVKRYKVALIGDYRVGKTQIFKRIWEKEFENRYLSTKQATDQVFRQVTMKLMEYEKDIILEFIDTGGQEDYQPIAEMYLNGVSCLVLCFDLSNRHTFNSCKSRWKEVIIMQGRTQDNPVLILCGTKLDKSNERQVSPNDIKRLREFFMNTKNFSSVKSIETSSKYNDHIKDLEFVIAYELLSFEPQKYGKHEIKIGDQIKLKKGGPLTRNPDIWEVYNTRFIEFGIQLISNKQKKRVVGKRDFDKIKMYKKSPKDENKISHGFQLEEDLFEVNTIKEDNCCLLL